MLTRIASVSVLLAAAIIACSSDEEAGAPATPEAKFCDALSKAYEKCSGPSDCGTPLAADCTKLVGLMSGSALESAATCLETASCDSDPLACVGKSIGDAKTTAAHEKLANDYCESCSVVGGETCKTAFFGTAQTPGLAIALLPFGDGLINAVDEACTESKLGKAACQSAFTTCLTATTTKFVATSISADSATCLIEGIKSGIESGGPTDGPPPDGGSDACTGSDCNEPACGPDNCAGCCDANGKCSTAATERVCGLGGGACSECTGGKICAEGACIDETCKASCTSGCCNAQGCQSGNANNACGTGGDACTVCGSSQSCTGAKCTVSTTTTFDFVAVGASLPTTKLNGSSWDAFSGLPDPIAKATSGTSVGETAYKSDTLKPVWNTTVLSNLTAAALKANLAIELTDSDTAFNDPIGGCSITLKDADFDGNVHTASCPKTGTSVAFTFDYKLKAH